MPTFKEGFNPTLKTLIKTFEYISKNQPVPMDSISLCHHAGYKWLFGLKEKGYILISRSKEDGRSHLVELTREGNYIWVMLKNLEDANNIVCFKCGEPIKKFFKVSNKLWRDVTGIDHDKVICKSCFEKMRAQ